MMLITTGNDLPGYRITRVLGKCFGLTVRSRNIGSQLSAGLKSLVGGELRHATMLANSDQAIQRLAEEAQGLGGNAIVGMRFDTASSPTPAPRILRLRHRGRRPAGL